MEHMIHRMHPYVNRIYMEIFQKALQILPDTFDQNRDGLLGPQLHNVSHETALRRQTKGQLLCQGLDLRAVVPVRLRQKQRQIRFGLHGQQILILPGAQHLLPAVDGLHHGCPDFLRIQWFFYIINGLQLDGSFQIFLVRIAAHKNNAGIGQQFRQPFHQLDPVHPRHTDVGQNNIRLVQLRDMQGAQPVVRLKDLVDPQVFPVNRGRKPLPCQQFVIRN